CCSTASPRRQPSTSPPSARARSRSYPSTTSDPPPLVSSMSLPVSTFGIFSAGQGPLHRPRVHPDRELLGDRISQPRRSHRRILLTQPACVGDDLTGELVRAPRAGLGRHQRTQPVA